MTKSELFDTRSDLWRESFTQASSYEDFLKSSEDVHRERWNMYKARIVLSPDQEQLIRSFTREMNVLVVSGAWCGDCARQCPIIQAIGECNPRLRIRFIDNQMSPALRDETRLHGASRVPTAVFLSEDWFELGRFGDRTLSAYRRKAERELGAACETGIVPPAVEELTVETQEWVDVFERFQLMVRLSPFLRKRHND